MTAAEHVLWRELKDRKKRPPFRRQSPLFGFVADFYCHSAALVVEVDGAIHTAARDDPRDSRLRREGIRVLRFSNTDVIDHLPEVLAVIDAALASAPPRKEERTT